MPPTTAPHPAPGQPVPSALERVAVGVPLTRLGVSLFPLYLHQVAPEIVAWGADLAISELPEAAVPTVRFANGAARPMLVPAGATITGGRQNRMVTVSVLVPPATTLEVPVSCVQAGRWSGAGSFGLGRSFAPRRVRRTNDVTVDRNLRAGRGTRADQHDVWATVDHELDREGVTSASRDLDALQDRIASDEHRTRTVHDLVARGPLPGQSGLAVAHGARVVALDVFAAPELLAANWEALLRSTFAELPTRDGGHPSATRVLRFVRRFAGAAATVVPGAGLGRARHVATARVAGQALELDDLLVHASAFALAA